MSKISIIISFLIGFSWTHQNYCQHNIKAKQKGEKMEKWELEALAVWALSGMG